MRSLAGRLERQFQRLPRGDPAVVVARPDEPARHLISFTGRKSGKGYTTPVNYVRDGDEVLLTTSHPWWKNLRGEGGAGAPAELCIRGRDYAGVAEVETSEEAVIGGIEKILGEQPGYGKWIGVKPGPDGGVNRDQAAAAVRDGLVAVRVKGVRRLGGVSGITRGSEERGAGGTDGG